MFRGCVALAVVVVTVSSLRAKRQISPAVALEDRLSPLFMGSMGFDVSCPLSSRDPSISVSHLQTICSSVETPHFAVVRRGGGHGQHEGTAEHRQETGQRGG